MGLKLFKDSQLRLDTGTPVAGDPSPTNFKVLKHQFVGGNTVAVVEYPNCTNFEGKKVLVWLGRQPVDTWTHLDPHFNNPSKDSHTPFARFRPTAEGIRAAVLLAESLGANEV